MIAAAVPGSRLSIEIKPEVQYRLSLLPSCVDPTELQFTMHYVAGYWDGQGDIFENGTLLGSATRALALGMLYNENRDPGARLHTYDWWAISSGAMDDLGWEDLTSLPRITRGLLNTADRQDSFRPLFQALHEREDYWPLVRPHVGYLPGHRDEAPPARLFEAPDRAFSLAFVDGCKSWYGTKYWFRELAPHLRSGSSILFQDYGHYTCFWLPMLIGLMSGRFNLRAYVAHTYLWILEDPPTAEQIDEAFPDEPTDLSRETYDAVLGEQLQFALGRNDRQAVLSLQMQRAAAYAYIGLMDESQAILDQLLREVEWLTARPYLKQARNSPAYTPEGPILL